MTAIKAAATIDATKKLMVILKKKTVQLKNKTKKEEAELNKALVAAEKKATVNNKAAKEQPETSDAPDPNRLIKGNINQRGERIYHTPWSSTHYKRTKINTEEGERWFHTEAEARRAGWRAPYR